MRGSIFLSAALAASLAACEHPSILLAVDRARAPELDPILVARTEATMESYGAVFAEAGQTSRTFGLFGGEGVVRLWFTPNGESPGPCLPVDVDGPQVDVDVTLLADGSITSRCVPASSCAALEICE